MVISEIFKNNNLKIIFKKGKIVIYENDGCREKFPDISTANYSF